jgi:hypothetical protein
VGLQSEVRLPGMSRRPAVWRVACCAHVAQQQRGRPIVAGDSHLGQFRRLPARPGCIMSGKLLRQQLNSVLQRSIDKKHQEASGGKKVKQQRRASKKGKQHKQEESEEGAQQRAQQVLASNLRYFTKTTASTSAASDLVAQVTGRPVAAALVCGARTCAAARRCRQPPPTATAPFSRCRRWPSRASRPGRGSS